MLFQSNPVHGNTIKDPSQSVGSRGVNNLASKMVLSLLPMNTPFFKLNISMLDLQNEGYEDAKAEIEKGLGVIERGVLKSIEDSGDVTVAFEVLKHLIITGNCLMFVGENGSRMFDLNKYVVIRSPEGEAQEIVLLEMMSPAALTDEQRPLVTQGPSQNREGAEKEIEVYTHIIIGKDRVKWHQEINGHKVPGTSGDVPPEANPWLALRFLRVDGEDYGRSYVEMYLGDLQSLEVLTTAVCDAAIAASKVIWLVNPNGTTQARAVSKAPNNSVLAGNADDVTVLRMDKQSDFRIAEAMLTKLERRLAYAFMINAEVTRDAERVTAEEIRFIAQELDDSLGGIYSILSKDFQLPYVKRRMHLLKKQGAIPTLPEWVQPVIVAGFAALGRGHDLEKLMRFIEAIKAVFGPEMVTQFIQADELISRIAVSLGIDLQGLMITAEERAASQEQAQNSNMTEQLAPEVLKHMGPVIANQLQGQSTDGPSQTQSLATGAA
jgi:hypothetical protein